MLVLLFECVFFQGLGHSGSLSPGGSRIEYGDFTSIMSGGRDFGPSAWFGVTSPYAFLLGWLPAEEVLDWVRNYRGMTIKPVLMRA